MPIEELKKKRVEAQPKLAALEREFPEEVARDLGFLPVRARKKDLTAIIDRRNGNVVKMLPIDPWL